MFRLRPLLVTCCLLFVCTQVHADEKPPKAQPAISYPVHVGADAAFRISERQGGQSPSARALDASRAIETAAAAGALDVTIEPSKGGVSLRAGSNRLIELSEVDARAEGPKDLQAYAADIATKLEEGLARERRRRQIAERVLGASGVLFFGVVALLLLRLIGRMTGRVSYWIQHPETELGTLKLGSVEFLAEATAKEALRLVVIAASWVLRAALIYTWALAALSLFPATRPLVGKAAGYLFSPALELLERTVARLPVLFSLILVLLIVAVIARFLSVYTLAVEKGELESDWLKPETARTTGTLLIVATGLLTLVLVTPLLTGSSDGSLPRVGLIGLAVVGLASCPYLASCIFGLRIIYGRSLKLGSLIEYGGQKGYVIRVALFEITLKTSDGIVVSVPHLLSLLHPTRVHPETSTSTSPRRVTP